MATTSHTAAPTAAPPAPAPTDSLYEADSAARAAFKAAEQALFKVVNQRAKRAAQENFACLSLRRRRDDLRIAFELIDQLEPDNRRLACKVKAITGCDGNDVADDIVDDCFSAASEHLRSTDTPAKAGI